MSNPKNETHDIPQPPCDIQIDKEIKPIQNDEECNVEAPAAPKPKRPYRWKGERTRTRSPEHNQKISKSLSGRQLSEEHKAAISEAMIGNQNFQ